MANKNLVYPGTRIRCSSSIANFKEKILLKYGLGQEYRFPRDLFKPAIFFGLYHPLDYARFLLHQGEKTVFWCGADITLLLVRPVFASLIAQDRRVRHVCENIQEFSVLHELGISAEIMPQFFGITQNYQISYRHSKRPHIFLSAHPGREEEYGLQHLYWIAKHLPAFTFHVYGLKLKDGYTDLKTGKTLESSNIIFHGQVPEGQFDDEIRKYQGSLRLNLFDGFSEVTAKSILLGQYPLTTIPYDKITTVRNISNTIEELQKLVSRKKPNKEAADWWRERL